MHVFSTFGTDLYVQSVLINKISASELSRKFIKSALLVGNVRNDSGIRSPSMYCTLV